MKRKILFLLFVIPLLLLMSCESSSSYRNNMRGKEESEKKTEQQSNESDEQLTPTPEEQPTSIPGGEDGAPPSIGVGGVPPVSVSWINHPEAIEMTAESVVKLDVYDKYGTKIGSGTGFAAIDPGYLVTAYHVIDGMEYAKATGEGGISFTLTEIIGMDESDDVAVLKLPEGVILPVIDIGGEPLRGEPTVVIGSQAGVMNLVTMGNYNGLWDDGEHTRFLFSTPVASGCSGAPLLNSLGYVIGIVSGTYDNAQNLNIAVPMASAVELYNQYKEGLE